MSKKVCLKSKNANGHVLPWVRVRVKVRGLGLGLELELGLEG